MLKEQNIEELFKMTKNMLEEKQKDIDYFTKINTQIIEDIKELESIENYFNEIYIRNK
jgi:hypothetical protein